MAQPISFKKVGRKGREKVDSGKTITSKAFLKISASESRYVIDFASVKVVLEML